MKRAASFKFTHLKFFGGCFKKWILIPGSLLPWRTSLTQVFARRLKDAFWDCFSTFTHLVPISGWVGDKKNHWVLWRKSQCSDCGVLDHKNSRTDKCLALGAFIKFRNVETICWSCNLHWSVKLFMKIAQVLCYFMWIARYSYFYSSSWVPQAKSKGCLIPP